MYTRALPSPIAGDQSGNGSQIEIRNRSTQAGIKLGPTAYLVECRLNARTCGWLARRNYTYATGAACAKSSRRESVRNLLQTRPSLERHPMDAMTEKLQYGKCSAPYLVVWLTDDQRGPDYVGVYPRPWDLVVTDRRHRAAAKRGCHTGMWMCRTNIRRSIVLNFPKHR